MSPLSRLPDQPKLHAFPTRRSSDLSSPRFVRRIPGAATSRRPSRRWCRSAAARIDRKSTRLNSSHTVTSYAVFCLKEKSIKFKYDPADPDWQKKANDEIIGVSAAIN